MAKRPVLTDIASGFGTTDTINANNTALKDWADNVVVRDGSSPNDMQADFDLGGNKLLNVARGTLATDGVNFSQLTDTINSVNVGDLNFNGFTVVSFTATAAQTDFDLSAYDWTPGLNQLMVYDNGVFVPPSEYTENTNQTVVFDTPRDLNDIITFSLINLSAASAVTELYDLAFNFSGTPDAGAIAQIAVPRDVTLANNAGGSYASARTAATAETVFDVQENGVSIGSITFAASAAGGVFSISGPYQIAAGNRLAVIAPNPADSTLADISITFVLSVD